MHLRLFSDFSHKHFVTYSRSVPKVHRALLNVRIMFTEAFLDQQPMQEARIREVAAWKRVMTRSISPMRSRVSIRTRHGSGHGSMCSARARAPWTRVPGWWAGTMRTRRPCSVRCNRPWGGRRQAGHAAYAATFVRHPPPAIRLRYQDSAGASRPQRRVNHDDLHACSEEGGRSGEPAG